jgi:hypothetical protein
MSEELTTLRKEKQSTQNCNYYTLLHLTTPYYTLLHLTTATVTTDFVVFSFCLRLCCFGNLKQQ